MERQGANIEAREPTSAEAPVPDGMGTEAAQCGLQGVLPKDAEAGQTLLHLSHRGCEKVPAISVRISVEETGTRLLTLCSNGSSGNVRGECRGCYLI